MQLTIIAKKVNSANGVWVSHKCKRGDKWYDVRFIDCAPKKSEYMDLGNNIRRVFIDVTAETANVREKNGRNILYIMAYTPVIGEALTAAMSEEKKRIEEFRSANASLTRDFFATEDAPPLADDDCPF